MDPKSAKSEGLKILTLDGSDARSMSELSLLREFMKRLEDTTNTPQRPCEFFDLIVAVDAAGFIAVLLGLFGMDIDEAEDYFAKAYRAVFDKTRTPEQREGKLRKEIEELLTSRGLSNNAKLKDLSFGGKCKVALCHAPAAHVDQCKMFRNYSSPQASKNEPTLVEALLATWATPGMFPSVHIGPENRKEELVSAIYTFSNPTREAIKEACGVFGADASVSCILSLGAGRRGSASVDDLPSSYNTLGGRSAAEMVATQLYQEFESLGIYYRFSVDHGLEDSAKLGSNFGVIGSHTSYYLSRPEPNKSLDQCVEASQRHGNTILGRLHMSKVGGTGSSHGLPALSRFYVTRKRPLEDIEKAFFGGNGTGQRVVVISGMGGSGKTQLALNFANIHERRFKHIFFVDASSNESTQTGLVSSMSRIYKNITIKEAMNLLAHPDGVITEDWLLILDNADNPNVNLGQFIPSRDHGSVLITTRNELLGCNLEAGSQVRLDVMSPDEAVKALITSIFGTQATISENRSGPSDEDRIAVAAIAEKLGYLPIAIIQAGCYIRQTNCLHTYLKELDAKRAYLLSRAVKFHREELRYDLSVYAALEITAGALEERALLLLGVLSFFHYTNFPLPLLSIAASSQFLHDPDDLLDRDKEEFDNAVALLKKILYPKGTWDEAEVNRLLDALQEHSLVTVVQLHNTATLRFHPLSIKWAHDRLSGERERNHQAAAIRLMRCGTSSDHRSLFDHLLPHVEILCKDMDKIHVNDRIGFARVILRCGKSEDYLKMCQDIHRIVEGIHHKDHVRTSRTAAWLAAANCQHGNEDVGVELKREVVVLRERLLGHDDPETAEAWDDLALSLARMGRYDDATELRKGTLRVILKHYGLRHRLSARYMNNLASGLMQQDQYEEAEALLAGVVEIKKKVFGPTHNLTAESLSRLAICLEQQAKTEKALKLMEEALKYMKETYGDQHPRALDAASWLAHQYCQLERYEESRALLIREVEIRKETQGAHHSETLNVIFRLGVNSFKQQRYSEAWECWKEELQVRIDHNILTDGDITYIYDTFEDAGLYKDVKEYLKQALEMQLSAQNQDEEVLSSTQHYIKLIELKLAGTVFSDTSSDTTSVTVAASEVPEAPKDQQVEPTFGEDFLISPAADKTKPILDTPLLREDISPAQVEPLTTSPTESAVPGGRLHLKGIVVPIVLLGMSLFLPNLGS